MSQSVAAVYLLLFIYARAAVMFLIDKPVHGETKKKVEYLSQLILWLLQC